jgi:hypothetical protein
VGQDGRVLSGDLPDDESGIFFLKGLDRNLPICPSGILVDCARIFHSSLLTTNAGRLRKGALSDEAIYLTTWSKVDCFRLRSLSYGGQSLRWQ